MRLLRCCPNWATQIRADQGGVVHTRSRAKFHGDDYAVDSAENAAMAQSAAGHRSSGRINSETRGGRDLGPRGRSVRAIMSASSSPRPRPGGGPAGMVVSRARSWSPTGAGSRRSKDHGHVDPVAMRRGDRRRASRRWRAKIAGFFPGRDRAQSQMLGRIRGPDEG